ncbi:MAG: DUF2797 domain-containing protein [Candidatus Heimdallarchaeota archaeon]|nr:DUF2797 domain-containing protein [Candidatus Heimdallarchaeota archaeon]
MYIFMGSRWVKNPISPVFEYTAINSDKIIRKSLAAGERIHFVIHEERYCIGSEVGRGEWISCYSNSQKQEDNLDRSVTITTGRQCNDCKMQNFYDCRMTCTGVFCNPSTQLAKEMCKPKKTAVYLTSIAGLHKVGVSLSLPKRWIEQGSEYAAQIAVAPGLEARRLEQLLSEELNLKLQIRNSQKIKQIQRKPSENDYLALDRYILDVEKIIEKEFKKGRVSHLENPKIIDLQSYYGDAIPDGSITEISVKKDQEFGGKIISLKGSIIIVENSGYHYLLDLKALIGRSFSFLDREAMMEAQTSLSDWF